MRLHHFIISGLLAIVPLLSCAQFYNGHQMQFGKNRLQYKEVYWQYYRFQRFDTYFYQGGNELAAYTSKNAEGMLVELEDLLGYKLKRRIIFLVYNRLSDFRQSNIGFVAGDDNSNVGGVTKIIDNKVFLYFEGSLKEYDQQVKSAIAQVLLTEMMYSGGVRDQLENSTIFNVPEWFEKGLISYLARPWDMYLENQVKDGIVSGRYKRFNWLTGDDAAYAGHSIWKYIGENFGESVIPNILYMTRISKSPESGFLNVLAVDLKTLSVDWYQSLRQEYLTEEEGRNSPDLPTIGKTRNPEMRCQQVQLDPQGKYIAYVTNEKGKAILNMHDIEKNKTKRILRFGEKLDQITDYSYPLVAWHPSGALLSVITEYKGQLNVTYYELPEDNKLRRVRFSKLPRRDLFGIDKVLDFSYSDDGKKYVFSAYAKGQVDIYVHSISANVNEQITNDLADDLHPVFAGNSSQIVFSSNRLSDSLTAQRETDLHLDLFSYNYRQKNTILTPLTSTPYVSESYPSESRTDHYMYLSDRNGIVNRWLVQYDSTISYVDTSIHYRYFTKNEPLTNYSRSIKSFDLNPKYGTSAEIIFQNGREQIFYDNFVAGRKNAIDSIQTTQFRQAYTKRLQAEEEEKQRQKEAELRKRNEFLDKFRNHSGPVYHPDSLPIDVNYYLFESETLNPYYWQQDSTFYLKSLEPDSFQLPLQRIYQTAFYTDYLVSQVDFSFLSNSYQVFTGGAFYFNPGMNLMFKLGTHDLFEDYRIVGGLRLSVDFESNEYLLSLENLKKKTDRQFIFHRQVFSNIFTVDYTLGYVDYDVKTFSNEFFYLLKQPFSQTSSLRSTLSFRYDRQYIKSQDLPSLTAVMLDRQWVGGKLEYIFDNTKFVDINIYNGTRLKVFGEYYRQINKSKSGLCILGVDVRNYYKIHRNLIWANRFAASTNFGQARLIYYLGGVDNMIDLPSPTPRFIPFNEVPIDQETNYVYQAVATNMRGFPQNIRNGDSFALINSELRWPFVKYFVNRPLSSKFLSTLQATAFADVGSAWAGVVPFAKSNPYENEIIDNKPVTVVINRNRSALVGSFGFGFRAMILGYYVRADWGWGVENRAILQPLFHLSLNLDF